MKRILQIVLTLLCSCSLINNDFIDIGDSVDDDKIIMQGSTTVFNSHFQYTKMESINYNNIEYTVKFHADNSIYNILTYDSNFRTSEGYKIGDYFHLIKEDTISSRRFYGLCVFKLESGWNAIFDCDNESLNDTSRISWFEK